MARGEISDVVKEMEKMNKTLVALNTAFQKFVNHYVTEEDDGSYPAPDNSWAQN